jgi:hypothetical protein
VTTDLVPRTAARSRGEVVWRASAFAPRASERAAAALGALCLNAFLAAQFFSLTSPFLMRHFGEGVATLASQAGIYSVALLLPALLAYGREAGSLFGTLTPPARLWASGVLGLSASLFLYGWLGRGYAINAVVHDLCPYLVIASAVILGSNRRAWKDVNPAMVGLFLLGLVLSTIGMTPVTQVVSEAFTEGRAGPPIVAYRMQGALAFWPLLLLTARLRRPLTALLIFAGVLFLFGQQILFRERSPSVKVLVYVVVFLVVLPRLLRREDRPQRRRHLAALAVAGAVAVMLALTVAPWLFAAPAEALLRRLSGTVYRGSAGMLTGENEGFSEAGMVLRTLQPRELVFGRGFGGHFVPGTPGGGQRPGDVNVVSRRQLDVGGLVPFLEGGLAFALVYYAGLAYALRRGRLALRVPLGAAAFFVVLVATAFLLREGWFTMSVSFDLFAVGLCMGYLLSRERERRPDRGARVIGVGHWPGGVAA